jgi:hypothetical protein
VNEDRVKGRIKKGQKRGVGEEGIVLSCSSWLAENLKGVCHEIF